MIAKMKKVFIAARLADRRRLLEATRALAVVHLSPVDPSMATPDADTLAQIDRLDRAIQMLSAYAPSGRSTSQSPTQAADRALQIQQESAEKRARLAALARQAQQLEMWGDVTVNQLRNLAEQGVRLSFYSAPSEEVDQFSGDLVHVLRQLERKRVLVVVAKRDVNTGVPDSAEEIPLPETDVPAIRAEAACIDKWLRDAAEELSQLAGQLPEMISARRDLQAKAEYTLADQGGLAEQELFALQGWAPSESATTVARDLATAGLSCVVQASDPADDEAPPTLIRYPFWAKPMKALFDMLGTIPGFRELDLSGFFMIAMPIFVAMLIGDGGYGLVFVAISLLFWRKLVARLGGPAAWLILVFSITTVAWGVLTANYFGVTPETIAHISGLTLPDGQTGDVPAMLDSQSGGWAAIGRAMYHAGPLYNSDPEQARNVVIKISFLLGCLHLIAAQLSQALRKYPDIRALANVGWAIVLPGMLGVIWQMFFIGIDQPWGSWIFVLIAVGLSLAVLFSHPNKNLLKMIGLGLISNIMPLVNTFSDTMSYIRLMAVGLASYYIAYSFNLLAVQVANGSHWLVALPVLAFGHSLNIALGVIAVFAHGVRLNMLEFSGNCGVQWSGYKYKPFAEMSADRNKES